MKGRWTKWEAICIPLRNERLRVHMSEVTSICLKRKGLNLTSNHRYLTCPVKTIGTALELRKLRGSQILSGLQDCSMNKTLALTVHISSQVKSKLKHKVLVEKRSIKSRKKAKKKQYSQNTRRQYVG